MLIVAWFVIPCIVSAIIASNKRRSALSWIVLGFLFGWFAVLAVALMRPLTIEEKMDADTGFKMGKQCPFCAETVQSEAKFCKHCQNSLENNLKAG